MTRALRRDDESEEDSNGSDALYASTTWSLS